MTMLRASSIRATSSSVSIGLTSPWGPSTAVAGPLLSPVPKPPKTTFQMERFMALHMIMVKMMPEAPTSEPETISTGELMVKPAKAPAMPE